MKRSVLKGALAVMVVCALGCPPKCPVYDAEGRLIEKNLLIHVNEKYKRILIALSENQTNMAYQRLKELAMLVKMAPTDTKPRSDVAAEALRMIEKARAALRLGDIFEARKAVRHLSAPIKMLNTVLVYQGPRPGRRAPSPGPSVTEPSP